MERVFLAESEEQLAKACLLILRERYSNPAWGYKPSYGKELTQEELEFLEFYEQEGKYLPVLLRKHAERIYNQLNVTPNAAVEAQWEWYEAVEELLSMPEERAVGYKYLKM